MQQWQNASHSTSTVHVTQYASHILCNVHVKLNASRVTWAAVGLEFADKETAPCLQVDLGILACFYPMSQSQDWGKEL